MRRRVDLNQLSFFDRLACMNRDGSFIVSQL